MPLISDNPALRSQLQSQVDLMTEFTRKAFDSLHQLSELNLRLARQNAEGAIHASREMLNCSDPAQLVQTAMKQLQPASERMRVYQQQLLGVLAGAQAEWAHAAEAGIPQAGRSASALADELVRQAAAGANVAATGAQAATAPGPGPAPAPGWPDNAGSTGAKH